MLSALLLATLINDARASCKIGCLGCDTVDSDHECFLCDGSIYFHMVSKTRSLYSSGFGLFSRKARNLVITKNRGECRLFPECEEVYGENCAKCAPGYVIGEGEKNEDGIPLKVCRAISTSVPHCHRYESDGLCSECEAGFFLHDDVVTFKRAPENQKQCNPWPNDISKCQTHFRDNFNNIRCLECEAGYMLSENMDHCLEHRDENCLVASNIGCEQCLSGYAMPATALNFVAPHLSDYSIGENILSALNHNRKRADLIRCQPQISHCVKYITISSFDTKKLSSMGKEEELIEAGDIETSVNNSDVDRRLLLKKAETRKLLEIKFGDDEQNKWVIGVSKGKPKNLDQGVDSGEAQDKKLSARGKGDREILFNDDGQIVTCGRCARGYFLIQVEPFKFECIEANFIEHCEEYLDRNTCYLCDKHFYLKDGKCRPIEAENFVDHCQYYTEDQDCLMCENEFALLRMVGSTHPIEVSDDFHEKHPYMKNKGIEWAPAKSKVELVSKAKGKLVKVGDRQYEKVEQMSITQLMTHLTLQEYIQGKKTMDDVAQTKMKDLGIHYDLSSLHLNFEGENTNTQIFKGEMGDKEEVWRRNKELKNEIEKAKQDQDEDLKHVETQEIVKDDMQFIEKQIITEDSQSSDKDIEQSTLVEEGRDIIDTDHDSEIVDDQSALSKKGKKEEDFVVLTDNKDKDNRRARKLLNLFNIFSFGKKPKNERKSWSLNGKRAMLKKLKKGRVLGAESDEKDRKLEELEVSEQSVNEQSHVSHVSVTQLQNEVSVSSQHSETTGQTNSPQTLTQMTPSTQVSHSSSPMMDQASPETRSIPENLKISKDNGVVVLDESHSESIHSETPKTEKASESHSSQESHSNSSQNESSETRSKESGSDFSDAYSMGSESERLKRVKDSKHIIMDTPEDMQNREIQKDKEILDRLFDSQGDHNVVDPDNLSDKSEKLRLIHNIINNKTTDLENPHDSTPQDASSPRTSGSPSTSANKDRQPSDNQGVLADVNLENTGITVPTQANKASDSPMQNIRVNRSSSPNQKPSPSLESTPLTPKNTQPDSKNTPGTKASNTQEAGPVEDNNQSKENKSSRSSTPGDDSHIRPEIRAVMIKRSLCVISNPIPNCSAHYRGDCIECEGDYYLINNICKPLEEDSRVMFCQAYNHSQSCVKCRLGFVLVSGKCLKFKQVVNCRNQVYYPNGKCLICKHGHIFDETEKKCVSREQLYFKEKAIQESQGSSDAAEKVTEGEDIGFDRHCLLVRNNSNKSCFICRPGYYMDKQGNCFFSEGGYKKKYVFW